MTDIQYANLLVGDYIHFGNCSRTIGPRGGVKERCESYRVTNVKTWKRTPRRAVTARRGMYDSVRFDTDFAGHAGHIAQWHESRNCPLLASGPVSSMARHVARVQIVTSAILGPMEFWRVVCSCGHTTRESFSRDVATLRMMAHVRECANDAIGIPSSTHV